MQKLESSRPKPGRMEETPKGGRGPPWTVARLERERERERERAKFGRNNLHFLNSEIILYIERRDKYFR